ncbi:MAG: hypothetical protein A3A72_02755 [Deltaproteobacteria bacterium RIFCSPLOWO2_01_FULL_38_9]|nr:MAG: hypothetical protein A3A72_02755 [Deltaproteobacteria bacterium RIFCSPLOWO2_01_FULL_38_9]
MSRYILMIGTALVVICVSLVYFQRESEQKGRHVFFLTEPTLVALDQETFNNERLFENATVLTATSLDLKTLLRQFSKTISAMTISPQTETLYISEGFNLIQISVGQKKSDEFFNLKSYLQSPIVALSPHPDSPKKLYGLCQNREMKVIDISTTVPVIKSLGFVDMIPQNMTVEEMWDNPQTHFLTLSLSQDKDTMLVEIDPEHPQEIIKELTLPKTQIKSGFYVSRELLVTIDPKYSLHIIDWEKQMIIGKYSPNQDFQYAHLYKHPPAGFSLAHQKLYLVTQEGSLMELRWKANKNVIVLNRDIKLENGKVVLNWKMPKYSKQALYFAELSLTPKEGKMPAAAKKKLLPLPPQKTQVPLGPLKKSSVELPLIETAYRTLDVSLFAIQSSNGKMMAPATTFTIDTEKVSHK